MKAVPRYFWDQNYEIGDSVHWALNDTHSTQEGKISCCYMVLFADYPTCTDGKPLSEQDMPKRIVDALNERAHDQRTIAELREALDEIERRCHQTEGLSPTGIETECLRVARAALANSQTTP